MSYFNFVNYNDMHRNVNKEYGYMNMNIFKGFSGVVGEGGLGGGGHASCPR